MNSFEIIDMIEDAKLLLKDSDDPIEGKFLFIRTCQNTSLDAFMLEWKPKTKTLTTTNDNNNNSAEPQSLPPPPSYEEVKFSDRGFPLPLMTQDEYFKKMEQEAAKTLIPAANTNAVPINSDAGDAVGLDQKYKNEGFSVRFSDIFRVIVKETEYASKISIELISGRVLPLLIFYTTKEIEQMFRLFQKYMNVKIHGDTYTFSEMADKLNRSIFAAMNGKSAFRLQQSNGLIDLIDDDDDDDIDEINVVDVNGVKKVNSNIAATNDVNAEVLPPRPPKTPIQNEQQQQQSQPQLSETFEGFTFVDPSKNESVVIKPQQQQNQQNQQQQQQQNPMVALNEIGNQVAGYFKGKFNYFKAAYNEQIIKKQQQVQQHKPHKIVEISEDSPFSGFTSYQEHNLGEYSFLLRCRNGAPVKPCKVHDGKPMGVSEFMELFDQEGRITESGLATLRTRGFYTGFDRDVQPEAWKILLDFYPPNATVAERERVIAEKRQRYALLKSFWTGMDESQKRMSSGFRLDLSQIEKDVVRTDREHRLFKDMDKVNLLRDILATYVCYNPDTGYVQGMNDLCAIVMDVMDIDEAMTFWSFKCLMDRVSTSFSKDQMGVKTRLLAISRIMSLVDPEFFDYLKKASATEMYFCYRWILVLFKREFEFNETKILWEPIISNFMCARFELFIACAMAVYLRSDIILNRLSFDQILHFVSVFGSEHLFPCNTIVTLADRIYARFVAEVEASGDKKNKDLLDYLLGNRDSFVSKEETIEAFELMD